MLIRALVIALFNCTCTFAPVLIRKIIPIIVRRIRHISRIGSIQTSRSKSRSASTRISQSLCINQRILIRIIIIRSVR